MIIWFEVIKPFFQIFVAFKFDTSAFLVERLDVTRVVTFSRGNMAAIYRSNKYKVTPLYSLKTEEGVGHIFKEKILLFFILTIFPFCGILAQNVLQK